MSVWLHSAILATGIAATVAIASASIATVAPLVAAKADRLALVDAKTIYVTVETRSDGTSELRRMPADAAD
jgi:hypothetical protein